MEQVPSYIALPYVSAKTADSFQRARNILISDTIDKDLAIRVMLLLKEMEREDPNAPIWIIVDSPGGEVQAGWTIYDAMNVCRCPINTVCYGEASSIAAVIFANGDGGHRYMTEHAKIMIHQPWTFQKGLPMKESELAEASADLSRTRAEIEDAIAKASGRTAQEVHEACEKDNRMDAKTAIEFGIADRVLR